MNFKGVIIEESLKDPSLLKEVKILETKVESVTPEHQTPWLKKWTLHTVEIPEDKAEQVAKKIEDLIETDHTAWSWYADFKNDKCHYIIYADKIFKVDLSDPNAYKDAKKHGISLGIPEYQVDFAPDDKVWER